MRTPPRAPSRPAGAPDLAEKAIAAATRRGRPLGYVEVEPVTVGEKKSADLRTTKEDRSLRSDERAAKVVGASGRAVQQAKAVQRDAPDLAEKVRRRARNQISRPAAEGRPRTHGPDESRAGYH